MVSDVAYGMKETGRMLGLNPCSNGIWSLTKKLIEQKASSENWNILPDKLILKSLLDAQLPISPSVFVEPEI